jgi:glycosyltransferase involved in cell wall biosynthesis
MRLVVVIASYDEWVLLPRLLASLRKQTVQPYQIIVVEGSKDKRIQSITTEYEATFIYEPKRNIGYVRNRGAKASNCDLLFFTNADCSIEDTYLIEKIIRRFQEDSFLISLSGPTIELAQSSFTIIIYTTYCILRKILVLLPFPITKYRPTANFLVIRKNVFMELGGFPEVRINEDGLFDQHIDQFCLRNRRKVCYDMKLRVVHVTRRFDHGGIGWALRYYAYTIPNLFGFMGKPLRSLTFHAEKHFVERRFEGKP